MRDSVLIIGTYWGYGVGRCMHDELLARGTSAQFIDLRPEWTRTTRHRLMTRCLRRFSPAIVSANAVTARAVRDSEGRFGIVTNGQELDAATVAALRSVLEKRGGGIACLLCDDPFNPACRSVSWERSLAEYSVVVATKRAVMPDLIKLGCRRVAYARFGYHPPIHRPTDPLAMGFSPVDVAFAGNADRDRLPIMGALVEGGPDLAFSLYGYGWGAHPALRARAQPHVHGLAYSAAMRAATVCPCLVRRANRDGHVMRSIELPAMGAFMLAERTDEHQEIFEEGVHCDYWSTVEELIDKSKWYARNPHRAAEIAVAGHILITSNPHTYADRALELVEMLGRPAPTR